MYGSMYCRLRFYRPLDYLDYFVHRTEFMPNKKSAKAMSGEAACPRCGCPVFEAEKMIAANKVS